MEFKIVESDDYEALKEIYLEAFPKRERRPVSSLLKAIHEERTIAIAAMEGKKMLGFLCATKGRRLAMVDYLAVAKDGRGKGVGSALLKEFSLREEGNRIVLLIEAVDPKADNFKQRIARKRFYLRMGFAVNPFKVLGKAGDMEVLSLGGEVLPEEFLAIQKLALGRVMFFLSKTRTVPYDHS